MFSEKLPSRYRLILALFLWFTIWFLIQVYAVFEVTQNVGVSFLDGGISLVFIFLGIAILYLLQRFSGSYLNRPSVRIGFMIAAIAEILYFQNLLLAPYYSEFGFVNVVDQTWLIRIVVAFSQVTFFSVVLWLLYYIKRQDERNKLQKQADELLRQAELSRLRQQLQPHFLFNSLNSINSLLTVDPQRARQMILNLSDFLRGTLKEDENKPVSLAEEINLLKLYLEIEKVRFGHRLEVELHVEDAVLKTKIPPLLIQPVLENAIKFGLYGVLEDVKIEFKAAIENGLLRIEIQNPFVEDAKKINKGSGFGLSMIQKRLQLLFHRSDLVKVEKTEKHFKTILFIPQL